MLLYNKEEVSKVFFRFWFLIILFSLVLWVWFWPILAGGEGRGAPLGAPLKVAFLDVGQGDAIFVETPDGVQLLIDGGPNNAVLRELGKQMPFNDRSLDVVLATHPDLDHIGGLVEVLKRYEVDNIIKTDNQSDTAVAKAFLTAVEAEKAQVISATAGQQITLGASTTLVILSPFGEVEKMESNDSSIVAILVYGKTKFLLTGDASTKIENSLIQNWGDFLESEVLKLGHHGSKTSSSANFLDIVSPYFAVVSAGKNNRYNHPSTEVVERVTQKRVLLRETMGKGSVVFFSDGEKVWEAEK